MRRESGQAGVEAALVMPMLVMAGLMALQLAALQQARILTEYAAFLAARAGIVWGANNERMRDAALFALLPTLGRTDDPASLGETWERARRQSARLDALMPRPADAPAAIANAGLLGLVRVDLVEPAGLPPHWRVPDDWRELDFDDPDAFVEAPAPPGSREEELAPGGDELRRALVLSIRVRYWYELRVPLANFALFHAWVATNAGASLYGALEAASDERATVVERRGRSSEPQGAPAGVRHERGWPSASLEEMGVLWELAEGESRLEGRRFFIPLNAGWAMRMQSALQRKWLVHEEAGR